MCRANGHNTDRISNQHWVECCRHVHRFDLGTMRIEVLHGRFVTSPTKLFPSERSQAEQKGTGGAYHYSCFLVPEKYRRQVAYPLGWLNYFGWIFTHAACCAIVATLIMSLVNLCNPSFAVGTRWQLFLLYMAVATTCWAINLRGLKSIPRLELFGCWSTPAHCPFAQEERQRMKLLLHGSREYEYTNVTALRLCYCSGICCLLRRSSCQGSEGERTIRVCGPEQ